LPQGKPLETVGRKATGALICQPATKGYKTCGVKNCNGRKKILQNILFHGLVSFPLNSRPIKMISLEFFLFFKGLIDFLKSKYL